ncbi:MULTISPECIES: methyltetrahydrofolate cobalamin methyltransferase [Desulfofundulus]|jgi:5-methyltetrahydrofolate corrinoid/iron sulfur protein methyltransferase|uniref:Methyltetrahydrofolate--corrinoid iron-sulfur protein Co-methyltransferase n=1 Tax=Desulfofundulus australicus DSM 11792 TaxID=1121425 RepID=A0A1M5BU60_9FIRM|nr:MULTISPECIES: methyltetrahydrofolate cobalamin methyltransferase [Desulfofundulus]MCS5695801.1 methyltetrahydrofolate cobalamin methyltransferase [Desulfofundulus thermocisternus]SHF45762.1 methyltetrahydrofolate--corrinoid iron-sulfur protein Co-methyltransferase [Desulfofundulus australicus DSM 11792]
MILIGERINGMFKDIREAILNKDPEPIRYWARRQYENCAAYLDINTGPTVDPKDQPAVMEWLVKIAQETVPLPCCIDSTNPEAIEAGLAVHKGKAMINSTTADQWKMDIYFPMAKKYNAAIIGLAMNEKGVPKSAADRVALAMEIVVNADAHGIPMEDLYIDPLMLPCNVAQDHGPEVLEAIRQVKTLADPPPRTTLGLSNASQRCTNRHLINRTFLIMCMAAGLDSAIADLEDQELLDAVAAANILLNKDIYCDSFLKTFRQR